MMSNLEQSFRDICEQQGFTNFGLNFRVAVDGAGSTFSVFAHWDGFTNSGHNCTTGYGDTIAQAVADCLRMVAKAREALPVALADEALPIGEAA